jgi:hypothetical protein
MPNDLTPEHPNYEHEKVLASDHPYDKRPVKLKVGNSAWGPYLRIEKQNGTNLVVVSGREEIRELIEWLQLVVDLEGKG